MIARKVYKGRFLCNNMNLEDKRVFLKKIKQLDPNGNFVKIDLERNEIYYSENIKQHRKIRELNKEEVVRAYLITKLLTTLGYTPDCIELEKEHTMGRKNKKTSARIDVLVKNKNEEYSPFMVIEVKAPDEYDKGMEEIKTQLFNVANQERGTQYLLYYTAHVSPDKSLQERVVSISFSRYDTYKDWEKEGKPNLMGIPKEYGIVRKPVFTKEGIPDLRKDVTKAELESIRRDLHNVLWGGGRYQGNEIFTFIMKLMLAKIYDEKETEEKKAYNFQIYYENGNSEKPEQVAERINKKLYQKALVTYLHYSKAEAETKDLRVIGDKKIDTRKVKFVVEKFQDVSLTNNIYDILGDFFERFLWSEFKQSKGQFFTPTNIVKFIIHALSLDELAIEKINKEGRLPYIIDPSCGSGTFLIEAMKEITKRVLSDKEKLKKSQNVRELISRNFSDYKKYAWAEKYIYGIDFNEDLALATKVNMVMHGDGSANIESEDALSDFPKFNSPILKKIITDTSYSKKVNGQYDVIVTNPPFSIELDKETKESIPELFLLSNKKSSENLFIERWYQLLKPKGRLGVVLPESVFDTGENLYIRLFLYKHFWVKAIVSLPIVTFEPYTSTKTSLLFAQKKTIDEIKEYDNLWAKYSKKFEHLQKDLRLLIKAEEDKKNINSESRDSLVKLMKDYIQEEFESGDERLSFDDLIEKYKVFFEKGNPFKIVGDWWIFTKVSKEIDYSLFMANVENVGYKRTTRFEKQRPNDLFTSIKRDNIEEITFDTRDPIKVLDYLRKEVKWD